MTDSPQGPRTIFDDLVNRRFGRRSWRLDPDATSVNFAIKHFWGSVTVRGAFGEYTGVGEVGDDGSISGRLVIKASTLDTRNKKRDAHLRSKDFFDVERHGEIVVSIDAATPEHPQSLKCTGTLDIAGHSEPIAFTATVDDLSARSVTLSAELIVERQKFGMTWNPLHMTAMVATANVIARFVQA